MEPARRLGRGPYGTVTDVRRFSELEAVVTVAYASSSASPLATVL
jgi:hypothetical protein